MALSRAERCLALLLRLLSRACLALLGLAAPSPPRSVPPPRRSLLLLPACQLAKKLRQREVGTPGCWVWGFMIYLGIYLGGWGGVG